MMPSQGSRMFRRLVEGRHFPRTDMGRREFGKAGYDWELQANVYELGLAVMTGWTVVKNEGLFGMGDAAQRADAAQVRGPVLIPSGRVERSPLFGIVCQSKLISGCLAPKCLPCLVSPAGAVAVKVPTSTAESGRLGRTCVSQWALCCRPGGSLQPGRTARRWQDHA